MTAGDDARPVTLRAEGLRLAYDSNDVIRDLDLTVAEGRITVIVGANGSGKSTLLRALGRLLKPRAGIVLLDGHDVHRLPTRAVAARLGVLPQQPVAPDGLTVADLVARGRAPHQRWFSQWSSTDEDAVVAALEATAMGPFIDRAVDELSGGQRQRAWIAMALAQETAVMLLDEPTTYLDLAHQVDVLDLLVDLNRREGRTIVAVLHDLNQACRCAHHLIALRDGAIVAEGPPAAVVTEAIVERVFGLAVRVIDDPETGGPLVVPRRRPVDPAGDGTAAEPAVAR
jgi:iron complex transport system ATP-binding protein